MKVYKITTALLAGVAAAMLAGSAMAADMTLKLGHLANEDNIWHKASVKFGEELSALTDGRIVVEVYPNESLGKELAAYDIAVNAVTPAVAKTTLALSQDPAFLEMIVSKIPRGRMLELSEAASMICWLATEENSFTTAATFDLSGGRATY